MLKILLVDDDLDDLEFLQHACKNIEECVRIIHVDACADLLDEYNKHKPDIIFMDINLPGVNGIECLKLLRSQKHFKSLPIIMYSTSSNNATIEESYQNEANFYIIKPETIDGIEKILKKVVKLDWNAKPALSNFVIS